MDSNRIAKKATLAINGPRLNRILTLAKYDYLKRYHGSHLGIFWALFKPIFKLTVYYFILSGVFGAKEENFALMLFLGLITWMIFSESTSRSMGVLKSKAFLIRTIQINTIDFHISNVMTAFVGYGLGLLIYFLASILFGVDYSAVVLFLPLVLVIIFILCLGVSLILSVLSIYFKDIEQIWTLILMFGVWTSGVFGRSEVFISAFPPLKYINPFLAIISNVRNLLLYSEGLDWGLFAFSAAYACGALLIGVTLFQKYSYPAMERM